MPKKDPSDGSPSDPPSGEGKPVQHPEAATPSGSLVAKDRTEEARRSFEVATENMRIAEERERRALEASRLAAL